MANRNLYFPSRQRADWSGHAGDMMAALGLKPGGHFPPEGTNARIVPAIRKTAGVIDRVYISVWVTPANVSKHIHGAQHRVMCLCPDCGKTVSAGRIKQHVCTTKE
jgi:hypothetical protein